MEKLIQSFKELNRENLDFDSLRSSIADVDPFELDFGSAMPPEPEPGKYSRKKVLDDPLEVTIVRWPVHGESAIHYHEGFWGYVAVVSGIIENAVYEWEGDQLKKTSGDLYCKGALIPEPDGVIHKIRSLDVGPALTIHFYFPPLDSFEGMKIFDLENQRIGTLNEKAKAASWKEPEECFSSVEEDAFGVEPDLNISHQFSMLHLYPKPERQEIRDLTSKYFSDIANNYDQFDSEQKARSSYIKKINKLVSDSIEGNASELKVLSIGCGTGRRDIEIRDMTNIPYSLQGAELSQKMAEEAKRRGIDASVGPWMELEFEERSIDFAYFLFGFGHLSDRELRIDFLKKVRSTLKKDGTFFMDVFNREDQYEWGPRAIRNFEVNKLKDHGFEKGDVFYSRNDVEVPVFLHYFSINELQVLLKEAGFSKVSFDFVGYRHNPGELVEQDEGVIFVRASA